MKQKAYATIDEYIRSFPGPVQKKLRELRNAIRDEVPDAQERMSYRMPTFYLNGNLVHFAAYARHIGFYPTPSGIDAFRKELSGFKNAKGSVQFPLDRPVPVELVKKIVRFRASENRKK